MAISWEEYEDGKALCLDADLDTANWDSLAKQYAEALKVVLGRIRAHVPPAAWNRLYIERWLDAGRLIIYPQKRGKKRGDIWLEATLDSAFVKAEYDSLPGEDSGVDYPETYVMALDGKVLVALRNAFNSPVVAKLLESLAEQTDYTIWTQEEGDTETLYQIYL